MTDPVPCIVRPLAQSGARWRSRGTRARGSGGALAFAALVAVALPRAGQADVLVDYVVTGDRIEAPLGGTRGDAARGRALVLARDPANCILCHAVPDPDARFAGNVGPPLAGVATRLTAAQMRLRIVDATRLDPRSVMPAYYRIDGLSRVAAPYRGKPILTAQQIEDLVAYLETLR